MKKLLSIFCGLFCLASLAVEVIPPVPAHYFNDYAGVVSHPTSEQLNQRLEQFERDSSCQVVVAVFPKMQSDSSIEDYTVRVAQSWKVGQKGNNNGAVLFVFTQNRKMYLQVGYGLEGALPDALCKRIIEDEIKPHFKAGNFDAGLVAGVNAILAATKGEYKGNGGTMADGSLILSGKPSHQMSQSLGAMITHIIGKLLFTVIVIFFVFLFILINFGRRGGYYSSSGWSNSSWSSGGSSWSGGGGGGFSGGGGSFGGGGAGGSW